MYQITITLYDIEVEVPSRRNRTNNPQDPNNAYRMEIADEGTVERCLEDFIQEHLEEIEESVVDTFLAERG